MSVILLLHIRMARLEADCVAMCSRDYKIRSTRHRLFVCVASFWEHRTSRTP